MKKRGQVTIFIILAIVILITVMLLLFILEKKTLNSAQSGNPLQGTNIKSIFSNQIEFCLQQELKNAIEQVSKRGWEFEPLTELEDGRKMLIKTRVGPEMDPPVQEDFRMSLESYLNLS